MPFFAFMGNCQGRPPAIDVAVIGGMLTATFLVPLLEPMFFEVISRRLGRPKHKPTDALQPA